MRKSFLVISAISCAAVIAVACGDEAATVPNPAGDGGASSGTSGASSGSTSGSNVDGSTGDDDDSDASTVTDGGVNIDPDASDDEDSGPDAAPCNALLGDAAPQVNSQCSSTIPGLTGGALVAGTYFLTRVAELAPKAFCDTQFLPVKIGEELVLTVDGTGTGTAQTVSTVAKRAPKTTDITLEPPANFSSPLDLSASCPPKTGGKTPFQSTTTNGKTVLILNLPYGNGGRALYRYDRQ
jgi:hypothetical protein